MIQILIADDHVLIREGLKKILKQEKDFHVIGEASNAQEIIDAVRSKHIDVLVLDISLPGKSGLDVLADVRIEKPKLPVLILSMHSEDRFALRAIKSGAAGYLTKGSAADELVNAIRKVSRGEKYISESLAQRLARNVESAQKKLPHEALSEREFQIFHLLAVGKNLSQIAEELSIAYSTVQTYRQRIFEKMGLQSNAQVIHYAAMHELID